MRNVCLERANDIIHQHWGNTHMHTMYTNLTHTHMHTKTPVYKGSPSIQTLQLERN